MVTKPPAVVQTVTCHRDSTVILTVIQRADELDGNGYWLLSPAADALAGRHPLAATLLLRSMIDFALIEGRSSRYKHAARHLAECASLASAIDDFEPFETHADHEAKGCGRPIPKKPRSGV